MNALHNIPVNDVTVGEDNLIEINTSDAWPSRMALVNLAWADANRDVLRFQLKWGDTLSDPYRVSTFEASTELDNITSTISDVDLSLEQLLVTWLNPSVEAATVTLNVKGNLIFPDVLSGSFDYSVEVAPE